MTRLWWIFLCTACLGDTTAEVAGDGNNPRFYWQMSLDDIGVKRDKSLAFDDRMSTKIHALYHASHTIPSLALIRTQVNLETLINVGNVIFSWRKKTDTTTTYTCHLHAVSLGEQRTIMGGGIDTATFCFEQQNSAGDYVRMLADLCVSASAEGGSRFIFRQGRDFACDFSDEGNNSAVLPAACLTEDGSAACLNGHILACAKKEDLLKNFTDIFKAKVTTACKQEGKNIQTDASSCAIEYKYKEDVDGNLCVIDGASITGGDGDSGATEGTQAETQADTTQ